MKGCGCLIVVLLCALLLVAVCGGPAVVLTALGSAAYVGVEARK